VLKSEFISKSNIFRCVCVSYTADGALEHSGRARRSLWKISSGYPHCFREGVKKAESNHRHSLEKKWAGQTDPEL